MNRSRSGTEHRLASNENNVVVILQNVTTNMVHAMVQAIMSISFFPLLILA